ncbi:MAG: hypothetical protein RIA62_17530 [Cyclobacteriaceae bacterium]|tara:strand:+ start:6491 stop:6952 length:462 start_codon:yes stop_codon:yes gene_type:complete
MNYPRISIALTALSVMMYLGAFSSIDDHVDLQAKYKLGDDVMYQTIIDSLKYPSSAMNTHSVGQAYVSFIVDAKGDVQDIVAEKRNGIMLDGLVVNGYLPLTIPPTEINDEIKAEMVRVIKLLGKFTPAQRNGETVSSVYVIPIKFNMVNIRQ